MVSIPRIAVYSGTFDPFTLGHEDVARRASGLFDRLVIAVAVAHHKKTLFALNARIQLVQDAMQSVANVDVLPFDGLIVEFCKQHSASAIVRGVRNMTDFDYESQMAAMNRKYTADEFRRLIDKLRAARPDMAFSSDFIVGHPGETEADFEATLTLIRDIDFALAYSFKYSQRPGTPAAGAPGQVSEPDKDRRLQALQALLRDQQTRFNDACVGRTMSVLFTGPGRHPGQIAGRSQYLQPIHVSGCATLIGEERSVRILDAHRNSLSGTLVQERQNA